MKIDYFILKIVLIKIKIKKKLNVHIVINIFFLFNGIFSGNKIFCSIKCYKDEANIIREVVDTEDDGMKGKKIEEKIMMWNSLIELIFWIYKIKEIFMINEKIH